MPKIINTQTTYDFLLDTLEKGLYKHPDFRPDIFVFEVRKSIQSEVDELLEKERIEYQYVKCPECNKVVKGQNGLNLLRKEFEDDLVYVGSDIKKIISAHGLEKIPKGLHPEVLKDNAPSEPDKYKLIQFCRCNGSLRIPSTSGKTCSNCGGYI